MKIFAYLFVFVLLSFSALAGAVETGYVNVHVINDPPEIVGMSTSDPVDGSPLFCNAVVKDELEDQAHGFSGCPGFLQVVQERGSPRG